MASFEVIVEVARPPADVFAYLTDVSKLPEWQSTASEAELYGAVRVGARIRERRHFLGRDMRTELEVTVYDPPGRFDVRSSGGPAAFAIRHTLSPTADGTRLRAEVDVTLSRIMRFAAQGPLKIAEREFRGDFARLKHLLEATPAAEPAG
jgi:carbon monoxide dehydrogenase subunit G